MIYYKVLYPDNRVCFYESISPLFVKRQDSNNLLVICSEIEAKGIISPEDNNTVCILDGQTIDGYSVETSPIAYIISQGEYEEYLLEHDQIDPEDESPQIPEEMPAETVMTRAELTQRIEFLEDCLLEMSKVIYDD